jgi:hypothetical protein
VLTVSVQWAFLSVIVKLYRKADPLPDVVTALVIIPVWVRLEGLEPQYNTSYCRGTKPGVMLPVTVNARGGTDLPAKTLLYATS